MKEFVYEHLKSGLSVNTHVGCSLGCKYCVLSNIKDYPREAKEIEKPENIVDTLLNNKVFYFNDLTPIFINNRTDPFLPMVKESTYKLLSLFCEYGIKSPIVFITKLAPDKELKKYFDKLNIMFIYTYTGLPKGIDYNSNNKINTYNMEKILKYVPMESRFHYYRPVIPGLNDSVEVFEETVDAVGKYFDTTIIGGIRVLDGNQSLINELSGIKLQNIDKNHKLLDTNFSNEIKDVINKYKINIVRHTSCAIAKFMKYSVKLDYFKKSGHCFRNCSNYDICAHGYNCKKETELLQVIKKMTKSEFSLDFSKVIFHDNVSQEMVSALECAYGVKVVAEKIDLCPSEKLFLNK